MPDFADGDAFACGNGQPVPNDCIFDFVPAVVGRDECVFRANLVFDGDTGGVGIAPVVNGDVECDVCIGTDRCIGIRFFDDERGHCIGINHAPCAASVRAGCENAIPRVEVELPHCHNRETCAERDPCCAAVIGHKRTDIGADIKRVGIARVDDGRVDRYIRQIVADVLPCFTGIVCHKDMSGKTGRRGVVPAERDDGVQRVGLVNGNGCDRASRNYILSDAFPFRSFAVNGS